MSQLFTSGDQRTGASASASVLPMNIQDCFPSGWTGWISLQSKGLSRVFSNTTVQKHQFSGSQPSLLPGSHIHAWLLEKPQLWPNRPLLAKWRLCFLIIVCRFLIAFLSRSKQILISWLQSPVTEILEPKKINLSVSTLSPFIYHEVVGPVAIIWVLEWCGSPANSCDKSMMITSLMNEDV